MRTHCAAPEPHDVLGARASSSCERNPPAGATLHIDADRQIAGRLDGATGRLVLANLSDPHIDELLDDLGELVAKKGGTVLVTPTVGMPSRTGLAAIYRY